MDFVTLQGLSHLLDILEIGSEVHIDNIGSIEPSNPQFAHPIVSPCQQLQIICQDNPLGQPKPIPALPAKTSNNSTDGQIINRLAIDIHCAGQFAGQLGVWGEAVAGLQGRVVEGLAYTVCYQDARVHWEAVGQAAERGWEQVEIRQDLVTHYNYPVLPAQFHNGLHFACIPDPARRIMRMTEQQQPNLLLLDNMLHAPKINLELAHPLPLPLPFSKAQLRGYRLPAQCRDDTGIGGIDGCHDEDAVCRFGQGQDRV